MNRSSLVAVGLAFLLTACAHTRDDPGFRDFGVRTASVAFASVQVVNDQIIVVSQEPIFVQQEEDPSRDNKIFWSLPPGGAYFFPNTSQNPGIRFDPPQMPRTECTLHNNDKYTYVCTYKRANRGKYAYTIRVTKNGTDIIKSDPTVLNN